MKLNIALTTPGGQKWIAGVIYIRNLVGALSLLSDENKPSVYLLSGVMGGGRFYKEPGISNPPVPARIKKTFFCLRQISFQTLNNKGNPL